MGLVHFWLATALGLPGRHLGGEQRTLNAKGVDTLPACADLPDDFVPAAKHSGRALNLNIITPMNRVERAPLLRREVQRAYDECVSCEKNLQVTWVVALSRTPDEFAAEPANLTRFLAPSVEGLRVTACLHKPAAGSQVGADERNSVMARMLPEEDPTTWLFFLDDDSIPHPRLLETLASELPARPHAKMIFFDQIRKARYTDDKISPTVAVVRSQADVRYGHVDAGGQIMRRDLVGSSRQVFGTVGCDGILIDELHNKLVKESEVTSLAESEVYLTHELSLYNWIKCVDAGAPTLLYLPDVPPSLNGVEVRAADKQARLPSGKMVSLTTSPKGVLVASTGNRPGHVHQECPQR
jgi:hypothetical protein